MLLMTHVDQYIVMQVYILSYTYRSIVAAIYLDGGAERIVDQQAHLSRMTQERTQPNEAH